ncbi:MAG: CoA-binding protein [Bacteroidales bacterium]|jgi:predicted CoA-binding protein|nr:CoA-binding protein [Bacteroidales bacterium]
MNKTIDKFLEKREIAISGVSPKKGNWGQTLMKELTKNNYTVFPINPNHDEVEGVPCLNTVTYLPESVENLILAVNPERAREIISQCDNTGLKRVWLNQGVGDGAYSAQAVELLREKKLEYVYGFCPMMFFGKGIHKMHYWFKKNLGKTPVEFIKV